MKHNVKRERETIMVRGIAAAIQAMSNPSWDALRTLLTRFGWKLTRDESNKQTNNESSNN